MNALNFWDLYNKVGSADSINDLQLSDSAKECRFCRNKEPEASFKKEAHLIPELLGKNNITIDFECDSCNQLFSKYESHLAVFTRPYLTLVNVQGKRKVPVFQSRSKNGDGSTVTTLKAANDKQRDLILGTLDDLKLDEKNRKGTLVFRGPSVNLSYVYRSLVRIGLALLPENEVQYHRKSFDWLVEKDSGESVVYIRVIFIRTLNKKQFSKPFAELYRAKEYANNEEEFPNHVLIIGFANQVYQVYLPFSEDHNEIHDKKKTLALELFTGYSFDLFQTKEQFRVKILDIGADANVKLDTSVDFSFGEIKRDISRELIWEGN